MYLQYLLTTGKVKVLVTIFRPSTYINFKRRLGQLGRQRSEIFRSSTLKNLQTAVGTTWKVKVLVRIFFTLWP